MKSAAIILGIVLIIFALNIWVGHFVNQHIDEMMPHIDNAESALRAGDVEKAAENIKALKEKWDSSEKMWEAFVDHRESENVETLLTRLQAMIQAGTPELMLPELEELQFFFEHLNDKQKFMLENIF